LSGDDGRTGKAHLRISVGVLDPEFARGHVVQNATTTVFGRQRLGALGLPSEAFGCPFFSGNTQAIAGHHFTEGEAYPQRRPAAAAGSANQRVNENNLFLPFSCSGDNSTAHTVYSDRLD